MPDPEIILRSTITCPRCGVATAETMPVDACLFFYDCPACGARLRPKPGDCCVFCSNGDVPCPPCQAAAQRGEDCAPTCMPIGGGEDACCGAVEAAEGGESVMLRPGLRLPAWSLVTDPLARRALDAALAASRWREKWAGLEAAEDEVRQAVLRAFAGSGEAPHVPRLAAATGLGDGETAAILRKLQRRDLVVFDDGSAAVTAAYPFCAWESGHRVRLESGCAVNALCAIDALGIGAMLRQDALVESACAHCGAPIRIATRDNGAALQEAAPESAVIWSGNRNADHCCATSGCTVKLFFCSDRHLSAWRAQNDGDGNGFRLSLDAALQFGRALFAPMLFPGTRARANSSAAC